MSLKNVRVQRCLPFINKPENVEMFVLMRKTDSCISRILGFFISIWHVHFHSF